MTEDQPKSPESSEEPTEVLAGEASPPLSPAASTRATPRPDSVRIPNFRILELLGVGGMGEVWAAEQEQPIQRRVALKVVKLGMDSREIVARFQYERRALALMSHPNIAAVYEAGTTQSGRPYFAMEYVPGMPVTDYCDSHQLGLRQRLELFLKICDGVQHAHQKGIIHRDLKPSNVLVTVQNEEPVPKLVDFGLAKATTQQMTGETMHTMIGAMVGTLEYMSPEQAQLTGLDVDTRSDIYSLGVLLYKLLVGTVPFPQDELRGSHLDEVRRIIREEDPSKPSTCLTMMDKTSSHVSRARGQEHGELIRRISGDLDWITLKALAKDRTQRYQTANALAMDIRRHLADEPVLARPPSAIYKARKFVRRHRAPVAAALLVLLAVVFGTVGTTTGLLRALRAERRANLEAETARQVSDFLVELFRVADPNQAQGETITARQILDEGSRRISHELRQQPLTQARLMDTMGTVYRHLGLYRESRALLENALELRREQLGDAPLELAESLLGLAALDMLESRPVKALAGAKRALAIREAELPPDSPEVGDALMTLGWVLANQSQHEEALPLFARSLEIRQAMSGTQSTGIAEAHHGLGISHWRLGRHNRAEEELRLTLETYESVLGVEDSRIGSALNDLAALYQETGRDSQALPLLKRALAIKERVFGPNHPEVASSLNNLAIAYDRDDRPSEAEPLFERGLAIIEASHGSRHQLTALALANLAWIRYRQGDLDKAEPLYERAFEIYQGTVGQPHRNVAILLEDWSRLYADRGELAEAERLLAEAAGIWEGTVGPDHPSIAACLVSLADVTARRGKTEQARVLYQRALSIREEQLGQEHRSTREVREALDGLLERMQL
jgi:non-specific serine/threonine protein kinase/serine/threonine-protein kinase